MYEYFNQDEKGQKKVPFKFSPKMPSPRTMLLIAIIILVFVIRFLISLKLDWTWFYALGYSSVFWRTFWAKLQIGGSIFLAAFVLNALNIYIVYRISKKPFRLLIALPVALVAALIVSGNSSDLWLAILRYFHAVPFGITDPQYQLDIGFYVFSLPVFWLVYRLITTWLVVNAVTAVILYLLLLSRGVEVTSQDVTTRILSGVEKAGFTHIGLLIGLALAWQAVQFKLSTYELLYSQAGSVIGAGAADIGARLPAYYIMMVLSLLFGLVIMISFRRRLKLAMLAIAGFLAAAVLISGIYPGLYQKFVVDPDELGRETPYLERNIEYTRLAYGLDKLTEVEYPVGDISAKDISANRDIIDNIRLLDHRETMNTYAQQQEIRSYYDFVDVDSDRYMIDGKLTQVMLSGRELNQDSLPEQARTFNNLMFKYTHGFGVAMSPANAITDTGLPKYLIQDIPPQSSVFQIKEPRIYFGEATKSNVIVNTGLKEFDYPVGDNNQEYLYEGKKGIPMTFLNKALLSIRDMQLKYMLSDYIKPESQYLETRSIRDRVQRIAPFLIYDNDPYLVIGEDGKFYYLLDAYTFTDLYPYSDSYDDAGSVNYMRNSVKITMDAYSGEVGFYLFDENDPIIKTYNSIYPGLFKKAGEMPEDLRSHVRYPEDLFTVQSLMLRDYHMGNPTVFYNREDRWEFAQENYSGKQIDQVPYFSIISLPGDKTPEFVFMRAFTPARKQNMVGWLAGRSDGENYGKLLLYKFPKGLQIPGTIQVESLIDQDPVISGQLTLWGSGGSNIVRGNLLVYPISGSLLYVEPLYIEAEQNKFPQLKKIFVFYKDKIVMEDSLEAALTKLFGGGTITQQNPAGEQVSVDDTVKTLIDRLATLYNEGKEKLKAGDWAGYGQIQKDMDNIIKALEEKNT